MWVLAMPDSQSILIKRTRAPAVLQMGQRTFDRLRAAGKIGPREITLGGSIFYNRAELERWAASAWNGVLPDREQWLALQAATKS